ncbi:carbohydrate ABC transporter permease [Paenibacillus sp. YN15]|uniref:carbohydrate ABC transporter permease n=1 Tax=Paenibacillus sp. YN15 TaxID=1742774 RepID=UPI000DCCAD8E|nr:carbohydrate ABC transporter permease [Paenibacillus sp. YN15]RAU93694.1 ABC transporter permease [Paenibacillus sp. YN15]
MRRSTGQKIFNVFNILFFAVLGSMMILPFINIIAKSFSSSKALENGGVTFWPVDFTLVNYHYVLQDTVIWRSFAITVYITVVGTLINLVMTSLLAYPLSRDEFVGRRWVLLMVLFTMIFSAPLIPTFLLIRDLHLMNTLWVLMIPGAISAFNFFIMRSFFGEIPKEIIDSSRIDGCGETRLLFSIVAPLSKPVLATMSIFYAVGHWNTYQAAIYYINNRALYPLQVRLREMIVTDEFKMDASADVVDLALLSSPEGIKMVVIIVATLPIIIIYPFMQKHFVKGVMIGSVKA